MTPDDLRVRGTRLTLRLPRPGDAPALFALASDPEVTRWFSWGPYTDASQPRAWLAEQAGVRERGERLELVVEHPDAGAIGITGLSEASRRDRRAVMGTWLGRAWWGTGANRETKALLCHLGFAVCGLERIAAYANVDHIRSQRALERIGFRHEGTLRAFHRHQGEPRDVVMMALLRANWQAGPLVEQPVTVEGTVPAPWLFNPGAPPS